MMNLIRRSSTFHATHLRFYPETVAKESKRNLSPTATGWTSQTMKQKAILDQVIWVVACLTAEMQLAWPIRGILIVAEILIDFGKLTIRQCRVLGAGALVLEPT